MLAKTYINCCKKYTIKRYKPLKRKKYNKKNKNILFFINQKFIIIICILFISFLLFALFNTDIKNIIINKGIFSDNLISKVCLNNSNFFQISNIPLRYYPEYTGYSNSVNNYYNLSFNLTYLYYYYSYKFNIVEIKYNFSFYDEKNNSIIPSDLAFFYNLHIFCQIQDLKTNVIIYSMANVYANKNFYCIEYLNINQKVKFGIKIYKTDYNYNYYYHDNNNHNFYFFEDKIIEYNNSKYQNDNKFDPKYRNELNIYDKHLILKESKINNSIYNTKFNIEIQNNKWIFQNIYNNYFCYCKGYNCKYISSNKDSQNCKYYFYLSVIDNNKNIYKKTDYLLADFIESKDSADDAYPIFKQMIKLNISAHYMTKKQNIYKEYCGYNEHCKIIIKEGGINGDFLEKYLDILLKLKAVISGATYSSIDNIFYNAEYITFIDLGHGLNYFKPFLYNDYTSPKRYNKLIMSSNILITIAKKYGWKEENIIKICLPKWDKYNIYNNNNQVKNDKSIFIFLTWRNLRKGKNISNDYFNNIFKLLKNDIFNEILLKNSIKLYYGIHQCFDNYKNKIRKDITNINLITNDQISDFLTKANLLVTDFSSIIFDLIYQRKPVILFIPDAEDPTIKDKYDDDYFNIINGLKNGTIYFENIFFKVEEAINKIIYYINNNFEIESNIKKFYDSFELKCEKNITKHFINYLENLK